MSKNAQKRVKISLVFCLVLLLVCSLFIGCEKNDDEPEEKQSTYLFLGDSIAEALLGPSPITERDSYGYYSIVGQVNGAKYYNRAISGLTSIGFVNSVCGRKYYEEEDAFYREYWIKNADVIFISMLGNDVLCSDMIEFAIETGKATTAQGTITLSADYQSKLNNRCIPNMREAMEKIYELNPNVTVVWQTLYNPFFDASVLIDKEDWDWYNSEVGKGAIDGKYTFRKLADILVNAMNDVVYDYQRDNPDKKFYISDVKGAFDAVFAQGDEEGEKLVFSDCIHPSIRGHALIAETLEKTLCELGLSSMDCAVDKYKTVVTDRMGRIYPEVSTSTVLSADSFSAVTNAYFAATESVAPSWGANATPLEGGQTFKEETIYTLESLNLSGLELAVLRLDELQEEMEFTLDEAYADIFNAVFPDGIVVFNQAESYLDFFEDGTFTLSLQLSESLIKGANGILGMGLFDMDDFDVVDFYNNVPFCDYNTTYDMYFRELFPGFTVTDLKKSVELLSGVGCSLIGVDTESEQFDALDASLKETGKLPDGFRLPDKFGIKLSGYYSLETLGEGDEARTIAYLRLVRTGEDTVPMFCILIGGNDDPYSALWKIEFCSLRILFKLS